MIGDSLQRLARQVVRPATYEAIVAPSIADLQYEAGLGWRSGVRGYVGVWRALVAAIASEIASDCVETVRGVRPGAAIVASGAVVMILTIVLNVPPMLWRASESRLVWHHDAVLLLVMLPIPLTVALPAAALPFAASLARVGQPGAQRAAILVASISIAVLVGANYALRVRVEPLATELRIAAAHAVKRQDLQGRPLWQVRDALEPEISRFRATRAAAGSYERVRASQERQQLLTMLLLVLTCALCGASWRQPPLASVIVGLGVFVTHAAAAFVFMFARPVWGAAVAGSSPFVLLLLVACLIALRTSRAQAAATASS